MARVGKRRRTLKRKSGWFFLAIFSVLIKGTVKDPESPTCAVLTPVETGSQSAVICHFSSPLVEGDDFSVELHQTSEAAGKRMAAMPKVSSVLDCYHGGELRCRVEEGYKWSWKNDPDLTVELNISQATASHAGRYVCKKTPHPLGSHTGCVLNVKEKGPSNQRTRCEITIPKAEGGLSAVSCHFTEDPRIHKHYFNVLRYDHDRAHRMPELVLACSWPVDGTGPACNAADGYFFDSNKVSKKIDLIIPNTTKAQEGIYVCEDALSLAYNMKECELTVKEGRDTRKEQGKQSDGLIIALTVVSLVLFAALLVIAWRNRTWKKNNFMPCVNGRGSEADLHREDD